MIHVQKSTGLIESFNSKKLRVSIERTCISIGYSKKQFSPLVKRVVSDVQMHLKPLAHITSEDIRIRTVKSLHNIDHNVEIVYKNHKHIW